MKSKKGKVTRGTFGARRPKTAGNKNAQKMNLDLIRRRVA